MAALALMWEARAADGRGAELLEWVRSRPLDDPATGGAPLRRETFAAPGDRVLVITWWSADTTAPAELPDPPADLVGRPVHRWRFSSVEVTGTG